MPAMEWRCGNVVVKASEVVGIVRDAGAAIMTVYETPGEDWAVVSKSDNSPLTKADLAANKIICDHLTRLYPTIPIVSEENKLKPYEERKTYKHFFCVDPLDGTKEFIKRNGQFTVNVGLCEDGEPVLGVVGVPAAKVPAVYYGVRGVGALREDEPANIPEAIECAEFSESDEGLTVVASASHNTPETDAFIAKYHNARLTSLGSSLKLLLVAEGKAHIYPRLAPTCEWDTCASHAVVVAAGGEVLQHGGGKAGEPGQPLRYNKPEPLNPFFVVYGRRRGAAASGGASAAAVASTGAGSAKAVRGGGGGGGGRGVPNALLIGAAAAAALAVLGIVLASSLRGAHALVVPEQQQQRQPLRFAESRGSGGGGRRAGAAQQCAL